MKAILVLSFTIGCLTVVAQEKQPAPATQLKQSTTLTTTKGKEYTDVKIQTVEADGIKIFHSAGVSKIPYEELPEEMRKKIAFDPVNAAAFRKASEEKNSEALKRMNEERTLALAQEKNKLAEKQLAAKQSKTKTPKVETEGESSQEILNRLQIQQIQRMNRESSTSSMGRVGGG